MIDTNRNACIRGQAMEVTHVELHEDLTTLKLHPPEGLKLEILTGTREPRPSDSALLRRQLSKLIAMGHDDAKIWVMWSLEGPMQLEFRPPRLPVSVAARPL